MMDDDFFTDLAASPAPPAIQAASSASSAKVKRKKKHQPQPTARTTFPDDALEAFAFDEDLFAPDTRKGEPLLEQIFNIINKLESKQEVQYQDLLSKVNGIGGQISQALDLRGSTDGGTGGADAVGDGCMNQVAVPVPVLQASEVGRPQIACDLQQCQASQDSLGRPLIAPPMKTELKTRKTLTRGFSKARASQTVMKDQGTLYVKISVQALGEDKWRCPEDMTGMVDATSSNGQDKFQPALGALGTFAGRVKVKLISARSLKNADIFGKSDPYCVCGQFNGDKLFRERFHTRVVNDTLEPGWNEEHTFQNFSVGDQLHLSVKDKDIHTHGTETDDVLGMCSLAYDQVFPHGFFGALRLTDSESLERNAAVDLALEDCEEEAPRKAVTQLKELLRNAEKTHAIATEGQVAGGVSGTLQGMSLHQKDTALDVVMACVISTNAIIIGISIDHDYEVFRVVDVLFTCSFLIEMLLKFKLHTIKVYFTNTWSCFDFFIIVIDVLQLILSRFIKSVLTDDSPPAALFRMLRLARLMRLVRFVNLEIFEDLVAMISGIMGGMSTLFWAIVVFLVVVYVTSLVFREFFGRTSQVMLCPECGDVDITEYFNSVPRSMLTVFRYFFNDFTTIQGVSMYEAIQSAYGTFAEGFVCLIFFVVSIGVFNVITAIFVESTLEAAQQLQARKVTARLQDASLWSSRIEILIRKLFEKHGMKQLLDSTALSECLGQLADEPVGEDEFTEFVQDKSVVGALNDLEIDAADHRYLFHILDADNTGSISLIELIDGLRRLRGFPRRSDIITIDLMVRETQDKVHQVVEGMDKLMESIEGVGSLLRHPS